MIDFYRFKQFEDYSGCIHAVSTKSVSEPYTFSLALHTGEEELEILNNRKKVASLLGVDDDLDFIVADQTHSDHIKVISEKKTKGWEGLEDAVFDCDALITNKKGVILTILTADCVPILLYDREKEVVAAVHAGWKGTKSQIVAKTVLKMKETYGCSPRDILAGIAPSIGRCCYEVGEDVAEHFFSTPEGLTQKGDKFMLDLPFINKLQLLSIGIKDKNIEMSHICTACEVDRFFSYRKEQGCSGRFMSMIGLT
jgi:YfiH family protein